MRITFAVALVALLSSSAFAQESVQVEVEADSSAVVAIDADPGVADGEVFSTAVFDGSTSGSIVPVVYQSGTTLQGAVEGAVDAASNVGATIEGAVVTEPSSVVSGEVIDTAPIYTESAPMYTESAPMADGTVISDGGAIAVGQPVAASSDCGCGGSVAAPVAAAPAPVVTYSSPPVQYSAPAYSAPVPVSNPCCNQRRGFFARLFGN